MLDADARQVIEREIERLREWTSQMEIGQCRFLHGHSDCTFEALDAFGEAIERLQTLL